MEKGQISECFFRVISEMILRAVGNSIVLYSKAAKSRGLITEIVILKNHFVYLPQKNTVDKDIN